MRRARAALKPQRLPWQPTEHAWQAQGRRVRTTLRPERPLLGKGDACVPHLRAKPAEQFGKVRPGQVCDNNLRPQPVASRLCSARGYPRLGMQREHQGKRRHGGVGVVLLLLLLHFPLRVIEPVRSLVLNPQQLPIGNIATNATHPIKYLDTELSRNA